MLYKVLIILVIITIIFMLNSKEQRLFSELRDMEITKITINDFELDVEVVNSAESTRQGLSDRDEIGSDGMLFIFPESYQRNFWMYNMRFDLDFVWINGDRVVGITKDVKKPKTGTKNEDLELININEATDKVLELNVGGIDKYDIGVGDHISLEDYDSNK